MNGYFRKEFLDKRYYGEIIKRTDGVILTKNYKEGERVIIEKLIFKDKNGEKLDITRFLPEGWKIVKNKEFSANRENKEIKLGNLKEVGALFTMFHEIGHAISYENNIEDPKKILEEYTHNLENRQLTKEDIIKRGEKIEDYEEILVYDPYGKSVGFDRDEPFFTMLVPKKVIKNYGEALAKLERNAWAYALNQIRNLRNKGIIIENELPTLEKLVNFIYSCLLTYEEDFKKRYKDPTPYFTKGKKFEKIEELFKNWAGEESNL